MSKQSIRPRFLLHALQALVLVATVGCAPVTGGVVRETDSRDIFLAGWNHINERYLDPVNLRTVTLDGFKELLKDDAALALVAEEKAMRLMRTGSVVAELRAPGEWETQAWADAAARLLEAVRETSPEIRAKGIEANYEQIFRGSLAGLDKYSRYAGRERAKQFRAAREGFGGIGISIRVEDATTTVIAVHPNTPASRGGLMIDDRITHVDGEALEKLDQNDVILRLRGAVDTPVALTVRRGAAQINEVRLVRAHIVPPTVTTSIEGGIFYIKLSGFNQASAANLRREIRRIEREEPPLRGIILDLRGNPGGLLDQAVAISNIFLNQGRIVSTRGRHHESYQVYDATASARLAGVPMIVVVNGRSASASEIVAAALRDGGRAIVLGSSSFGKGTVQTILPMPNGGEMSLTWARLLAPSGFALQDQGVVPSVCTSGDAERTSALMAAVRGSEEAAGEGLIRHVRVAAGGSDRPLSGTDRRAACPPSNDEKPLDVELARHLFAFPAVYARTLHASRPSLAEQLR
ncbi:MAG: S41 family peptidase [Alphaproteobacteria bacterium]|nr:S41 family peptidase [Alphaproteobacteria bacterium]